MKRPETASPSEREAIEATAAAWLAQRDDGLSAADAAEFARWRAADVRHETAVVRLEKTWAALQGLRNFRPEAARHPDRDLLGTLQVRRGWRLPAVAGAALAASLVIVAAWWSLAPRVLPPATAQEFSTTVDGYQRVTLDDASQVQLNGDTAIEVRFTDWRREVRLTRGEAYFTVTKNPNRPFIVFVGGVAVRAVGTAFNVRVGAAEVDVLVTEGRVELTKVSALQAVPHARGYDLNADERLVVALPSERPAAEPVVERVAPDVVRSLLAWQEPRLVFADQPLAEVAAQFNRRNPVQLVLGDVELRALPIGGSFRADNVDAFVRLLEAGGDVVADRSDPTRIVLRSRRPSLR